MKISDNFSKYAKKRAWCVSIGFAIWAILSIFVFKIKPEFYAILIFYAILLLNTFFSIRIFATITRRRNPMLETP